MRERFGILSAIVICAVMAIFTASAYAQEIKFFRIGTGGIFGTYYPVGAMVAQAIGSPPGSLACDQGGSCGVPDLIAVPQSSNGSSANIAGIARGSLESGFAQSDIVYWAYSGTGIFEGQEPVTELRVIASLYHESIQIVARKGANISSVRDLGGMRVSLDEPGSGTLVDARIVLSMHGLTVGDLKAEYIKPGPSIRKIELNELDAFFIVAGYPTVAVARLATGAGALLVPIAKFRADAMVNRWGFFAHDIVPAGTYAGIPETPTVSVGAQWVVGAGVDDELVYEITKALWNKASRHILDNGHPIGKTIVAERALDGVGIPLHAGAERFYRQVGLVD